MKKGFSLVEIIISISLISIIGILGLVVLKKAEPTYADPYENIRKIIGDASNVFLNSNRGIDYKEKLYKNKTVIINTNDLIKEGLLAESYFIDNINENKNVTNLEIVVLLDEEGFINYSINIV